MSLACPRCKRTDTLALYINDDGVSYYICDACWLACDASDLPLPELDWPETAVDYDIVNQMLDEASR